MGEAAEDEVGGERAGGVHRGAADWARPEACEDDVTTDRYGREGADVLRTRGRPEDRAREADRQDKLRQHGLRIADPDARLGCPEHADLAVDAPQKKTGEGCA